MSQHTQYSARLTFSPDQLRKLTGPIVLSTLSGVAALIDESLKHKDSKKALDRAVKVASHSLLGLYEADYDTESRLLSVDATVVVTDTDSLE